MNSTCRPSAVGRSLTTRFVAALSIARLALLLVLFALLSFGARQLFFTFDEPSHITAGYAFLARGASWTVPLRGHPLLVDAWEALPIYLGDPNIPLETLAGWNQDYLRYVEAFAPFLTRAMERSEVAGRTPAMLLTVLLAAVVYRWGADLWGKWAGLLALGTLVFDPTLLAHGRLATNDVGVTALGTLGLYLLWRWVQVPTWKRAAATGLVLGLAMLAKGSGILWVAVGLGWAIWTGLRQHTRPSAVGSCSFVWLQVLLMGALSFLVLWGMYGFTLETIPGWPPIPVPAPRHWVGLLLHANPDEYTVFAWGEMRIVSWLWYFPLAFLIKNPLPLLIALTVCGQRLLAVGALLRERQYWRKLQVLGLFSALYTIIAIVRGPNLGYRHMLPIHPMLYLLIAGGTEGVWRRLPRVGRWVIVALGLWYVVGTMRVYPYNLAFFNEMVGGPDNGWRYLADCNTDWGQGWKALRAFREEESLTLDYYSGIEGYAGIAPYDLWDKPLPPLRHVSEPLFKPWLFPEPGNYVISANTLSGLFLVYPDNFSWFRYHAPDAVIALSLFYYHVDSSLAPAWLAQCTVPVVPLNKDAVAEGFGEIELRSIVFDCSQSWVYPNRGETHGVYALHEAILQPETLRERLCLAPSRPVDTFADRRLRGVPLAFRQWEYGALPAFALYEWEGSSLALSPLLEADVAPADTPPAALTNATFYTEPVPLNGPLTFLGVATCSQEETLEVETWWQVTEGPITRPLSIMAHLLAKDGAALGVADGLGVSPLTLVPGDVVVQRHRFPAPAKETEVWLRTGVYWLDTMERWPVASVPGDDALFVPLEERLEACE